VQPVPDLTFHHMIHTVLDVVEEKAAGSTDAYLGLLYSNFIDEHLHN
jgi:hypothetical protein